MPNVENKARFSYGLYVDNMKACRGGMERFVAYESLPEMEKKAWGRLYDEISKDSQGAVKHLVNKVAKRVSK